MAGIAGTHGRAQVGISGRCPGSRRRMAGIALTAIVHVIGRFVLRVIDQIRRAITVTGRAITCGNGCVGRRMIHRARHKRYETVVVAGIALPPGGDVAKRLGLCIGSCIATGVTARALRRRPCMIHFCRLEGGKVRVTGIALCRRRDVGAGRFSERRCPVVTGRTGACRAGVVGIRSTNPAHRRIVAGIALG